MNILEQEDIVKGLPDQALFQQAENPSGQLPPFLVISEIQRRTDMRKRFESSEAQPQGTVADQIVMEGLGATMPQQAPMSPPPPQGSMLPQGSMPPPASLAPPPSPSLSQMEGTVPLMGQGMAAGGILGMSNGGVVRMQSGTQVPLISTEKYGDIPAKYSSQGVSWLEERDAAQAEKERRANFLRNLTPSQSGEYVRLLNKGTPPEEALNLVMGDASQLSPDALEAYTGVSLNEEADAEEQFQLDPAALEAYTGINFGAVTAYDETGKGLPFGDGFEAIDDAAIATEGEGQTYSSLPFAEERDAYVPTADYTGLMDATEAYRTGISDRLTTRKSETEDLIAQIRDEGRRDAFSAALMQLGAGIAGGDMAGGWQRAGEVATSTNAVARDAARAEQRGMRDYEEAALSSSGQAELDALKFKYEQDLGVDTRALEQQQSDREFGLKAYTANQKVILENAGLNREEREFYNGKYEFKKTLDQAIAETTRQYAKEEGIAERAGLTGFNNYMDGIREFLDDLGGRMPPDEKIEYLEEAEREILDALSGTLPAEFFAAFQQEHAAAAGGGTNTNPVVHSIHDYNPNK